MGMDLDYIAAKQTLEQMEKLLANQPHGKREKIADDIEIFVDGKDLDNYIQIDNTSSIFVGHPKLKRNVSGKNCFEIL